MSTSGMLCQDDGVLLLVLLVVFLAILWVLVTWARWLPRRTATPSSVTRLAYSLLVVGALASVGTPLFAFFFLVPAWWHAEVASERQRAFSKWFATVFYVAPLMFLSLALLTALWLLFATCRWHWFARPEVAKGVPPYR